MTQPAGHSGEQVRSVDSGAWPSVPRLIRGLGILALALVVASLIGQFARHELGHDHVKGLVPLFSVDEERNIPTFFSVLLLLAAATLLADAALHHRRNGRAATWPWALLAAGFVFMAYDEAFRVHERLIVPMRELLNGTEHGLVYFGWVVPGLVVVAVVAVVMLPFLRRLPPVTRRRFLVAGAVYLTGAIVMEMVGGQHALRHGQVNWGYTMIVTVEESLEMAGLIVFLRALLLHRPHMLRAAAG